jgi:hypothetical protein
MAGEFRTREQVLQGMNEVEFFARCATDFKFFCERLLGITEYGGIHPFQLEWFQLAQNNDSVMIKAPSNSSKTEIMGVAYPIWYAIMYPGKSILLISKTISQAKDNLLMRIKEYIESNEILKELVPNGQTAIYNVKQAHLTNKTKITNVPYNINIKGYRGDLIVMDECDSYEDLTIFYDHVLYRRNPGAKLVGISTPEGPSNLIDDVRGKNPKGFVFKTVTMLVDKNGKPSKVPYNEKECFSIWPERWTVRELLDQPGVGGPSWEKNVMCNVMLGGEDAIFDIKKYLTGYDRTKKFNFNIKQDAQYFIGCDFAISIGPRADFNAYVVVEKYEGYYTIKHIETHKGKPDVNRIEHLYHAFKSMKTTKVICDMSHEGALVIKELRLRGITTLEQPFHSYERTQLYLALANVISADEVSHLIVPRYPDDKTIKMTNEILEQMIGFVRKEGKSGNRDLIDSKAKHDDIVAALAMAVKEAAKMKDTMCVGVSTS